jgi:hypothetical protein
MAANIARQYPAQLVHYLRKTLLFSDSGAKTVGVIPAGALILKPASGAHVVTAFNAATTNTLDIGTDADGDLFATALAAGSANFVACDEAIGGFRVNADTTVTATYNQSGTAASAGEAEIIVAYIPDNDG